MKIAFIIIMKLANYYDAFTHHHQDYHAACGLKNIPIGNNEKIYWDM